MNITEQLYRLIYNHRSDINNTEPKGFIMSRQHFDQLRSDYNSAMNHVWMIGPDGKIRFAGIRIYRSEDADEIIIF